jgi:hypothetical protein
VDLGFRLRHERLGCRQIRVWHCPRSIVRIVFYILSYLCTWCGSERLGCRPIGVWHCPRIRVRIVLYIVYLCTWCGSERLGCRHIGFWHCPRSIVRIVFYIVSYLCTCLTMRTYDAGSGMKGLDAGTFESGTTPGAKLGLYSILCLIFAPVWRWAPWVRAQAWKAWVQAHKGLAPPQEQS